MPNVIFDFTDAAGDFDRTPVPAGMYEATIDARFAQEVKIGKAKGTPYVSLGFAITAPEAYAGRIVFNNYMLAGPGAGGAKSLLRALGLYDADSGATFRFDTDKLHGYEVSIRVTERLLDDGTPVNDVKAVMLRA